MQQYIQPRTQRTIGGSTTTSQELWRSERKHSQPNLRIDVSSIWENLDCVSEPLILSKVMKDKLRFSNATPTDSTNGLSSHLDSLFQLQSPVSLRQSPKKINLPRTSPSLFSCTLL